MAKIRDYKSEYIQRLRRGLERGFSRSQGRGHPKAGEAYISKLVLSDYDPRLEEAVRNFRIRQSLKKAARAARVGEDRLLRYLLKHELVEKEKRRYKLLPDIRVRQLEIYTRGRAIAISVRGFDEASKVGRYMETVREFLDSNDPAHLEPFIGDYVTDINGKRHFLETRPNVLYRIDAEGPEPFEEVYKIIA